MKTADELWNEGSVLVRIAPDNVELEVINRGTFFSLLNQHTSQQLAEREEELEYYKTAFKVSQVDLSKQDLRIESLQSENASLKEEVEGLRLLAFNRLDKLDNSYKTITTQAEEIKKLKEGNRIMFNRLELMKGWLNPDPHSDIDACLNAINHAQKSLLTPKQD